MRAKKSKANFIIIAIVVLLLLLVLIMQTLITELQREEQEKNISVIVGNQNTETTTIEEIIENAGSEYISMSEGAIIKIYVNFKYDLYDENGKSKEEYFENIIEQIVELRKESFYLIDQEKNIEIYVYYDPATDKYTITINSIKDFYDETDGDTYIDLNKTEIVHQNTLGITNSLYTTLKIKGMYYANTVIVTGEREELPNGYYTYPNDNIKARLGGGKVLNLIFDKNYTGQIAPYIYVTTKLEEVEKKYPNPGFGSSKEGFLGYRTSEAYIFLYEDEISIYPYQYKSNEYFDQYLSDYCIGGNLDKLVSDFTIGWSSYFEYEYDAENQDLKLVFPTRGISIDIQNNDSKGITIYNNYYLTDTVKKLIKNNKITIKPDEDLLLKTEQNRRESMK